MPFVVDLLPPSLKIEAAAALSLAMSERKSKGLFGRKQYEPIEVLARFGYPLSTVSWPLGKDGGRYLVFDRQALISGAIQFALGGDSPEYVLEPDMGEEEFLSHCQRWTKAVTSQTPVTINIPGLITQAGQAAPLLDGEQEEFLIAIEQTAQPEQAVEQLSQQLRAYTDAAAAWAEFKQQVYTQRDVLGAKLQEQMSEDKRGGDESLADLTSQVEAAISAKRSETENALAAATDGQNERRQMLLAELERFQENYKENPDNHWRDQIKLTEKALSEQDKAAAKEARDIQAGQQEFVKQQNAKIQNLKAELAKRLAAFEARIKRLDSAVDGFGKGCERRLAAYAEQQERVLAATLELSPERAAKEHKAVFYAARYPGGRWRVLPPQTLTSRGFIGAVGGLLGGLNLPFRPASKLAESLAGLIEKLTPGSELAERLAAANLLSQADFFAQAKAGLTDLIDQGKLDKKHAALFTDFGAPGTEAPVEPGPPPEQPAQPPENPTSPDFAQPEEPTDAAQPEDPVEPEADPEPETE